MKYLVKAPGRVNLIGEHTDYNQGFVLPIAIDLHLELSCKAHTGRIITAKAEGFGDAEIFSLDSLVPITGKPRWIDYIKAVCWIFEKHGHHLSGAMLNISSSIPIGSGLSSSAAIELAVAGALTAVNSIDLPLTELALYCQQAENKYIGVQCGIMDQYAVALGRKNNALLIDCRSLEYSYIPLHLGDHRLLIVDSRIERSLGASEYNRRREECEKAASLLAVICNKEIGSLRDVTLDDLSFAREKMNDTLYKRSRYVVEENIRVTEAAASLTRSDYPDFGYFMNRSHAGLRDLYEVSSPELDLIVDAAMSVSGVLGARMTGAGFGGCAVVLLDENAVSAAKEKIRKVFAERNWKEPIFYLTTAAEGLKINQVH